MVKRVGATACRPGYSIPAEGPPGTAGGPVAALGGKRSLGTPGARRVPLLGVGSSATAITGAGDCMDGQDMAPGLDGGRGLVITKRLLQDTAAAEQRRMYLKPWSVDT